MRFTELEIARLAAKCRLLPTTGPIRFQYIAQDNYPDFTVGVGDTGRPIELGTQGTSWNLVEAGPDSDALQVCLQ